MHVKASHATMGSLHYANHHHILSHRKAAQTVANRSRAANTWLSRANKPDSVAPEPGPPSFWEDDRLMAALVTCGLTGSVAVGAAQLAGDCLCLGYRLQGRSRATIFPCSFQTATMFEFTLGCSTGCSTGWYVGCDQESRGQL